MQDYTESEKESNIAFIAAKSIQSDAKEFYHANILISLLKECTKEKLLNSRLIRRLHYQIFLTQITGISFAFISNYFISSYFHQLTSNNSKISLIVLTTALSLTVLEFMFRPNFSKRKLFKILGHKHIDTLIIVSLYMSFLLFSLTIYFITTLENSWINTYSILLIIITFSLTFVFVAKLKNMRSKLEVVDSNLAKAIRTTSQYREHIASHFIAKAKLEIALKTAEDALENPRLYF
jgi:hypothetical protein